MPEESINIYMSLVDKVSGPLSGIFRGVRAYSTGYVPNPQRENEGKGGGCPRHFPCS